MPCCNCCCPDGESCCKAQGANGICCPPSQCCGTNESPVCCPEGECCVDDECGACPCEGACEGDGDCDEGCKCCDGVCVPDDTCCGACDEENVCPEGCYCCDGVCQDEPCDESCDSDEDCDGGFCCNGACQEEPCDDCFCPNKCGYELRAAINELTTSAEAVFTPSDCDSCSGSEDDEVANPQDPGDQTGVGGNNFVRTEVGNNLGFGVYAYGNMQFNETYVYIDGDIRRDYQRNGNSDYLIYCSVVDGVAKWRVIAQCGYAESQIFYDTSTSPFTVTKSQSSSVSRFADVEVALESCCYPPDITITVDLDELVVNGTSYPMQDGAGGPLLESCQELVNGVLEDCADYLADYPAATTYELTWTGECAGPCDAPPP